MALANLELHVCGECGIEFAAPVAFFDARRKNHSLGWHCPNGHSRIFNGPTEVQKIQKILEDTRNALQAKLNEEQHARLVAERERDKVAKKLRSTEKRVRQGVCPCCNRTFQDLAAHMNTKHKDYALPPGRDPKLITGQVQ